MQIVTLEIVPESVFLLILCNYPKELKTTENNLNAASKYTSISQICSKKYFKVQIFSRYIVKRKTNVRILHYEIKLFKLNIYMYSTCFFFQDKVSL